MHCRPRPQAPRNTQSDSIPSPNPAQLPPSLGGPQIPAPTYLCELLFRLLGSHVYIHAHDAPFLTALLPLPPCPLQPRTLPACQGAVCKTEKSAGFSGKIKNPNFPLVKDKNLWFSLFYTHTCNHFMTLISAVGSLYPVVKYLLLEIIYISFLGYMLVSHQHWKFFNMHCCQPLVFKQKL